MHVQRTSGIGPTEAKNALCASNTPNFEAKWPYRRLSGRIRQLVLVAVLTLTGTAAMTNDASIIAAGDLQMDAAQSIQRADIIDDIIEIIETIINPKGETKP